MAQGMVQSFMIGDMTKNFATCAFGIQYIGYVIMCSGLGNCLAALTVHTLIEKIGIFIIIMTSWACASTIMICFFFWNVASSHPAVLLVINILFAMAEGALTSQVHGYYGVIFFERKAAAFATFSISRSIGNTISFAYGNSVCVVTKVVILLLVNFIGICFFYHVYYDNQRLKKKKIIQALQPS
ncbi:protein unc-93 homolog A-like [Clytia hemisphaerica]